MAVLGKYVPGRGNSMVKTLRWECACCEEREETVHDRESWGVWQANKGFGVTFNAGSHCRAASILEADSAAESPGLCAGVGGWEQVL